MEPGIYGNISNEEYHKSKGLSASGLKLLARSPAHYKYSVREETPAMRRGTATHTAVFEPERFARDYIAAPTLDRRTKAGKEAWVELEASGKIVLSADEYADVMGMAMAVMEHSRASALVAGGVAETSIAWEYNLALDGEEASISLRARTDYIKPMSGGSILVDLKSAKDATWGFASDAYRLGYHLQAAHYMRAVTSTDYGTPQAFLFIAVEPEKPYGVMVYEVDYPFLERGYEETGRLYEIYARCVRDNSWPKYEEKIQKLGLPRWAA